MSDYRMIMPIAGYPAISQTDSSPRAPIGIEVAARDVKASTSGGGAGGVFVYCRGSNMASAGQFVQIQNGSAVLLASANAGKPFAIGVGAGNLTATNVYGWVQIAGRVDYAQGTNTSWGSGLVPYIGATAGQVVSNVVAGQRVQGVYVPADMSNTALGSAGLLTFDLNRPFIAGVTASL